ncbi:protein Gawky isoform X8 [Dermacentor albipictus]|uniref:protein Gawky isoform X8 n=1 Tax=Dermacentor albipictus TaxID=60249 RepID=UPI0031FC5E5B
MQGDDKRSDLFLGQGNSGTWDTRPGSDSREAGNVSAAWSSGTALAQNSCRNPCERGMGGEDMVWTGDEASVIHRSSSLGGQCASTGPSNSQPGPRHNRGTSAASSSSWAVHRQGNPGKPGVVREIGSSGKPSNDSTSEGADQLLGAVGGSEEATSQPSSHPPQSSRNCRPPRLGLLGGGESSLNNGAAAPATGWGAPPPGPQGGWGSGAAQWGGAASTRGPEYATGGPNAGGDAGGASSPTKPTAAAAAASNWGQGTATKGAEASDPKSTTVATRNVLEEPMSELRRMAAFSEGWGQSPINQDTPWDVPMSPGTKEPPTGAPWRAPVNNGTEVWENNMRSARAGGNKQPNPPQSAQGGKPLTKDLIYASKQFRILTDMGFKKEDVENALRINQMNIEDTLIDLRTMATRGNGSQDSGLLDGSDCGFPVGGRPKMRPDDDSHGPLGEPPFPGFHAAGGFQGLPVFGAGYGGGQGFKPPQVKGSNQGSNTPASLLNSTGMGGQNSSLTVGNSISSLSPALVQKILQQQQQQHFPGNAGGPAGIGARLGQPNVPSATQLRLLVQQIQMAVHAGHLNPQILNQPLAPQTLQLLYQLLQQIKVLHALQQQNQIVHKGPPNNPLQVSVQLTQTKQRILNLQNQIAAQQALFLKQQLPPPPQPPQQAPPHVPPPPTGLGCPPTPQDFLGAGKPGGAEGLHSDFRDLNLKDAVSQQQQHQQQQQQSRLNQWKLPSSLDEENKAPQQNGGGDFSRAPGPASKAGSLSSFLGGADGPWSSGACSQDGWPEAPPTTSCTGGTSSPGEGKDSGVGGYSLSDLVAEFEPGKPWKGASALKSAEDDPHLTPGSVVRSPLSVNTIKDSELFGGSWKQSPPGGEGSLVASLASLTSSTWAFTPAMHGSGNGSGGGSSKGNASKSSWGGSSEHQAPTDPWNVGPKTRGPPPGLSSGWDQQPGSGSSFLMLRNLTQQIDGSTLKTLCMQHGPLQLFHLYLKHGLALVQYASREEAAKAQSALHNCVLSNTTMMAYIPSESEVAQFLQLGSSQGQHPSSQPQQHQQQMAWGAPTNAYHQPPQRPPLQYAPGRPSKQPTEPWNTTAPPPVSSAAAVSSSNASHLWSFPGSGSGLWAAPQTSQAGGVGGSNQMDHDHGGPGVPQSSLNSFLPGDLLSGESI